MADFVHMLKVRKRAVVVEAVRYWRELDVQFGGNQNYSELIDCYSVRGEPVIVTLEGPMYARDGDWIIRGVKGERYFIRNDIFEETYDIV